MSAYVAEQVIYNIANAPIREYPFPHLYIESVFPEELYVKLRAMWPELNEMTCLNDTGRVTGNLYKERFITTLDEESLRQMGAVKAKFWGEVAEWLLGDTFRDAIIRKFETYIPRRFGFKPVRLDTTVEGLLVKDLTNYAINPHTDVPKRLMSLLFYCPSDEGMKHLGTSLYRTIDSMALLDPKLHHSRELFERVATMDYKPNSLFAFMRTDDSYHGVERIAEESVERDLLLYDIRIEKVVVPKKQTNWVEQTISRLIRA